MAAPYDTHGETERFERTFDGAFRTTYVVGSGGTAELAVEGVAPAGRAERALTAVGSLA